MGADSTTSESSRSLFFLIVSVTLALCACAWLLVSREQPTAGRLFFSVWGTRSLAIGLTLSGLSIAACARWRSRRALFAVLFVAILGVVSIGMLELIGAVGFVSYAQLFGHGSGAALGSQALPHLDVRGQTHQDIAMLWNLDVPAIDFHFRTDQRGYRNVADRDAADIYMLGDSFLVAGLLPFEQTLTASVEARLGRPTMNLALIGIGAQEECEILKSAKLPLREKLILQFVTEANDLLDSARTRGRAALGKTAAESTSFTHHLTLWLRQLTDPVPVEAARHMGLIEGQEYYFQWDDFGFRGFEDESVHVLAALAEVNEMVTRAGGKHGIVLIPSKLRVLGGSCRLPEASDLHDWQELLSPLRADVRRWCAENGVPLLDLTELLLAAASAGRISYFRYDTHWNQIGHEVATAAIVDWPFVRKWQNPR